MKQAFCILQILTGIACTTHVVHPSSHNHRTQIIQSHQSNSFTAILHALIISGQKTAPADNLVLFYLREIKQGTRMLTPYYGTTLSRVSSLTYDISARQDLARSLHDARPHLLPQFTELLAESFDELFCGPYAAETIGSPLTNISSSKQAQMKSVLDVYAIRKDIVLLIQKSSTTALLGAYAAATHFKKHTLARMIIQHAEHASALIGTYELSTGENAYVRTVYEHLEQCHRAHTVPSSLPRCGEPDWLSAQGLAILCRVCITRGITQWIDDASIEFAERGSDTQRRLFDSIREVRLLWIARRLPSSPEELNRLLGKFPRHALPLVYASLRIPALSSSTYETVMGALRNTVPSDATMLYKTLVTLRRLTDEKTPIIMPEALKVMDIDKVYRAYTHWLRTYWVYLMQACSDFDEYTTVTPYLTLRIPTDAPRVRLPYDIIVRIGTYLL